MSDTEEKTPLRDVEAGAFQRSSYGATPTPPATRTSLQKRATTKRIGYLYAADEPKAISPSPRAFGARRKLGVQAKKDQRGIRQVTPRKKEFIGRNHSLEYSMIRRHSHRLHAVVYRYVVYTIIFLTLVNFILETESYFQSCCTTFFGVCEIFTSCFFFCEYCLKLWTINERKAYRGQKIRIINGRKEYREDPQARLHFLFTSESLIDILSFLPTFIEVALGIYTGGPYHELVRMLRLVRILKLSCFWSSFRMVMRVLYFNWDILGSALLVCCCMLLVCSVLLYYLRPTYDKLDNFSSILACMYLAILMLTGQGEPNGVMPWYTRIIISVTALFAIAQFAIPASMLTWGFEQEAEHDIVIQDEREKKVIEHFLEGDDVGKEIVSSSSSDESDREGEWEGYRSQVAGESDSDEASTESSKSTGDNGSSNAPEEEELLTCEAEKEKLKCVSLTSWERKHAKRIFHKLAKQDGLGKFVTLEELKTLTDGKQKREDDKDRAQVMYDSIKKFTVIRENEEDAGIDLVCFYQWLGHVKVSFPRYGSGIFTRLLTLMEEKVDKNLEMNEQEEEKEEKEPEKEQQAMIGQSPESAPPSQQLLQFAKYMKSLEDENASLKERLASLEEELTQRKNG